MTVSISEDFDCIFKVYIDQAFDSPARWRRVLLVQSPHNNVGVDVVFVVVPESLYYRLPNHRIDRIHKNAQLGLRFLLLRILSRHFSLLQKICIFDLSFTLRKIKSKIARVLQKRTEVLLTNFNGHFSAFFSSEISDFRSSASLF